MDIHKIKDKLVSIAGGNAARVVAGFLLTQATVPGGLAPFGVAFVAAQAIGGRALFAMLGAMLGYLLTGFDESLRYMSVCLLIVSAGAAFRETRLATSNLFTPLIGTALSFVIGVIYWLARDFSLVSMLCLLTELGLIFGGAVLFRAANGDGKARSFGTLLLASCLLLSLSHMFAPFGWLAAAVLLYGVFGLGVRFSQRFVRYPKAVAAMFSRLDVNLAPTPVLCRDTDLSTALAAGRLKDAAAVLDKIGTSLPPPDGDSEGVEAAFDLAANEVCAICENFERCWDYEQSMTYAAVRVAALSCDRRGRLEPCDLSERFRSRCANLTAYVDTVNRELGAILYRRQFRARIEESREQLARQYRITADALKRAARELSDGVAVDGGAEERLSQFIADTYNPADAIVSVYRAPSGRWRADISGLAVTDGAKLAQEVSRIVGRGFNAPKVINGVTTLWESEPISALLGVAAHKRGGSPVSGDSGAYFTDDEQGKLFLILSDGMGSGAAAARESRRAVKLLENLLRAGIDERDACELANSALSLGESSGFVTVDLLVVDLFGGRITSCKYGAAPTYCKRGANLDRVICSALPAGLKIGRPDVKHLDGGQWVILITDGIADSESDQWLTDYIARLSENDGAGEVASRILGQALKRHNAPADDMTVLALKTGRRVGAVKKQTAQLAG
ncbi:hypothetical protein FACS1894217_08700 [Clostridia bacterium]|nr:hypothetical protein FACS1894217_08700 [Clostridia bacterium]